MIISHTFTFEEVKVWCILYAFFRDLDNQYIELMYFQYDDYVVVAAEKARKRLL